jgi:hypothetical protein
LSFWIFFRETAVRLDLRLTRAADADGPRLPAASTEPFEVAPLPFQPREQVLGLREVHLQPPFLRAGAHREDVEDQCRAVQHFHLQLVFEFHLLRR